MSIEATIAAFVARQALRLANRWAKADQADVGEWRGTYTATAIEPEERDVFRVKAGSEDIDKITVDCADPVRLVHLDSGIAYSPCRHQYASDYGSIPWVFQGVTFARLKPRQFPMSYACLHDPAYLDAAIRVRRESPTPGPWTILPITRRSADILLFWGLSSEVPEDKTEPTRLECQAIYRAVRSGAAVAWNRHRKREKKETA